MTLASYYRAVAQRWWAEMKRLRTLRSLFIEIALFAPGIVAFWRVHGIDKAVAEWEVFATFVLAPAGAPAVIATAVNVVRAPYLLANDARREADRLRAERDDAGALQAMKEVVATRHRTRMDVLTGALMELQALGTRPMPVNKSDVPQLEDDLTAVVANITGVLYDHFPASDVALFLNDAGMSPIERAGNADAARLFGLIAVYQENLKDLIGRYSNDGD